MNEALIQEGDVLVRRLGALGRITLNRPKALNALTLGMSETMTNALRSWANDPSIGAILIDGAGERGLCAGGDLRALYDAAKGKTPGSTHQTAGGLLCPEIWAIEYALNVMIARYPKPVVALMDGVVMGGGVGISAHAAHRVVTERSSIAMPEVGIGFFPDVGASFLLARAPGAVGCHLALTGSRVGAADAIYCGLADIHIATARLAELPTALADCRTAKDVAARLVELSVMPEPARLPAARAWIDSCYGADDVETIAARLQGVTADEARVAREAIARASPTSLKVTLRNLRAAASFKSIEESFRQDYRIALACIAGHDFIEGIRATIVDKDRTPKWRPEKLEAVTPDIVDRHFRTVGALELKFAE